MTPAELERALMGALEVATDEDEFPLAESVSFEDAGVMTNNRGLVLRMDDGAEFQVSIVQSAYGTEPTFEVDTRVRLKVDVDRYPHFIAPAGITGTVVDDSGGVLSVRMDEEVPGAEEWSNELVFSVRDGDNPADSLEVLEEEVPS